MIIQEDHFYQVNMPMDIIDILNEEIKIAKWYTSPTKQCRSDIVGETRIILEKLMPFEIYCCGFFKNDPLWKYPIHKDRARHATINIQLVDNSEDYLVYTYSEDLKERINIPYIKDKPLLLNTKKFHSTQNLSTEKVRYLLTVGCITESYEVIRDRFKQLDSVL